MAIQIITDSACDMSMSDAAVNNVIIIPLHVLFGADEYIDGITLDHKRFYEKLIETDVFPTTSQISPFGYNECFATILPEDQILCITLSSKLSGCYQSACIAAMDYDKRVIVVDSENVSVGERILVDIAVKARDEGKTIEEIADILETMKKKVRLLALLDTLEYLKKGGRISSAAAIAGNLLAIKPVISVIHGEVVVIGKARGSKAGNNKLNELISQDGGIDFNYPVHLAYSGLDDTLLLKYKEDCSYVYENHVDDLPISTIGCTIGTHAGPGTIIIAYICSK